jgi:glycosyltransferase involved in cell wall biosynthesis
MSKYPRVLFFRYEAYSAIDTYFQDKTDLDCEIQITADKQTLQSLWDPNFPILVTYGPNEAEYSADLDEILVPRFFSRCIHMTEMPSKKEFTRIVNTIYLDTCIRPREETRPVFSAFTTCYKSYEKIERPYKTLKAQTMRDWEWILLDDTPGDEHFQFLTNKFKDDPRVRLYKRATNSGNIGNVKNEAIGLCRGLYVLELDHDDEIDVNLFQYTKEAFEKYPDAGFAYTDFIAVYENGTNQFYGDFIALGYGGYYMQKYENVWRYVYITPQVNNITLSHLVSLPNHARMWRRDFLNKIGSYSEFLPINDDQEILMRSCMNGGMIKIPLIGYKQYHNDGGNNFSYIRNHEINRIGPNYLVPQFYKMYDVQKVMKERGAYDNEDRMRWHLQVWKRNDFTPQWFNHVYLPIVKKQFGILGRRAFFQNLERLKELYADPSNDFYLLTNEGDSHEIRNELCALLDQHGFSRMKCYSLKDTSQEELVRYFNYIYKYCEDTELITFVEPPVDMTTRMLFEFTG